MLTHRRWLAPGFHSSANRLTSVQLSRRYLEFRETSGADQKIVVTRPEIDEMKGAVGVGRSRMLGLILDSCEDNLRREHCALAGILNDAKDVSEG